MKNQIAILDPAKPLNEEEAMAKTWAELAPLSPAPEVYAEALRRAGCDVDERVAPYVIRGLLRNLEERFDTHSPQPSAIAAVFLDDTQCKGALGLKEDEKEKLREIRDRHRPAMSGSPAR